MGPEPDYERDGVAHHTYYINTKEYDDNVWQVSIRLREETARVIYRETFRNVNETVAIEDAIRDFEDTFVPDDE